MIFKWDLDDLVPRHCLISVSVKQHRPTMFPESPARLSHLILQVPYAQYPRDPEDTEEVAVNSLVVMANLALG